jgi:hypothetical protein
MIWTAVSLPLILCTGPFGMAAVVMFTSCELCSTGVYAFVQGSMICFITGAFWAVLIRGAAALCIVLTILGALAGGTVWHAMLNWEENRAAKGKPQNHETHSQS